jgi:hypothetical protein
MGQDLDPFAAAGDLQLFSTRPLSWPSSLTIISLIHVRFDDIAQIG